ncbi:hypothetical protein [Serratia aquatilis]|uniref:Uncharacterized protein n=1 Tax=Serratia aquatilis TaxID=1737515 RepID=A0ABV6EB77_9GAMM
MDNKSLTFSEETQLPQKAILPAAWQLNELQKRFIEDLWLSEDQTNVSSDLADNLAASG